MEIVQKWMACKDLLNSYMLVHVEDYLPSKGFVTHGLKH